MGREVFGLQQIVFDSYPRARDQRLAAERRVRELGGTDLRPDAGPWRRFLRGLIGWKATKRIHDLLYRRK